MLFMENESGLSKAREAIVSDLPEGQVIFRDQPVSEWNWPDGWKPGPELMQEMERTRQERTEIPEKKNQ